MKKMMSVEAKGHQERLRRRLSSYFCSLKIHTVHSLFLRHPSRNCPRVIYIVSFRTRRFRKGKEIWKRVHGVEVGPHHATSEWDRVVDRFCHLWLFTLTFSSHDLRSLEKLIWQNIVSDWRVQKVPKTQNMVSCSAKLKPK
jgi:hypothetical protein